MLIVAFVWIIIIMLRYCDTKVRMKCLFLSFFIHVTLEIINKHRNGNCVLICQCLPIFIMLIIGRVMNGYDIELTRCLYII